VAGRAIFIFLGQGLGVPLVQVDHGRALEGAELLEAVDPDDVGAGLAGVVGGGRGRRRTLNAHDGHGQHQDGQRHDQPGSA